MELTGNIRLGSHTSTHYEEMIIISRSEQIHEGDVHLDIQVLRCNQNTTVRGKVEGRGIEATAQASVAQYMNHDTFLAERFRHEVPLSQLPNQRAFGQSCGKVDRFRCGEPRPQFLRERSARMAT